MFLFHELIRWAGAILVTQVTFRLLPDIGLHPGIVFVLLLIVIKLTDIQWMLSKRA